MKPAAFILPPLETIAQYHPQWALAAADGVPVDPDLRVLSVQWSSAAQIGTGIPASFAEPVTKYAIFAGASLTVDPTTSYAGNVLKGLNDVTMSRVTGTTFTLLKTDRTGNFTPVFDEVPLQVVPELLAPFAGVWSMRGPTANVKGRFTLNSAPNGGVPFTEWIVFSWAVLEGPCSDYFCLSPAEARRRLRDVHGIGCCGSPLPSSGPPASTVPSTGPRG